jgi:hypothetical protein
MGIQKNVMNQTHVQALRPYQRIEKGFPMTRILLGIATAATLALAIPAQAQVSIKTGERGVGVRVGGDHHARGAFARSCKTVTIRKRNPDGSRVVRKIRRCDGD